MYPITDSLQEHSVQKSPLDEMLKAKGVLPNTQLTEQEEQNVSQALTIANFSPQSIVMSNANSVQGGLLQSVMAAASNNTGESSAEKTLYGKQTAANLMQSMEKTVFEDSYAGLLQGLKTDLEQAAEQALTEGITEESIVEESIDTQEQGSSESAIVDGEQSINGDVGTAQVTTIVSKNTETASVESSQAPSAETPAKKPEQENVNLYV